MQNFAHRTKVIGTIVFEVNDSQVSGIAIYENPNEKGVSTCLPETLNPIVKKIDSYLEGHELSLHLEGLQQKGTEFQKQVWNEISKIPYGKTRTYQDIANTINKPKAVRAVGTACGANKFAILVPCHRVVSSSGRISGYRWGNDIKRRLLELESKKTPTSV